jgi:para-nitrobenzyl esterase
MAPHALEVALVFDNVEAAASLNGGGARPQALADRLGAAWCAFAETGDPNVPELPPWPGFTRRRRAVLLLDDEPRVADDPQPAETELARRFVQGLR